MQDTAITAYNSIVTLSGNISFMNNIAIRGGALALDLSAMNIARNTSVRFYNNTAREVGRTIYISTTHLQNLYKRDCF